MLNRNVLLNLVLNAFCGVSDSLWAGAVLVAFLYQLTGNNAQIGYVEALQGGVQLFSALPVGYLGDKYGRSPIIAVGGVAYLLAALAMTVAIMRSTDHPKHAYWFVCASLALFGLSGGVVYGPAQALFADSIPTGARTKYYNWLFITYLLCSVVGPAVSIVLFVVWGNTWSQANLRTLIYVGMSLVVPSGIIMFCFRDSAALGEESEAVQAETDGTADNSEGGLKGTGSDSKPSAPKASDLPTELKVSLLDKEDREQGSELQPAPSTSNARDRMVQRSDPAKTSCGGLISIRSIPYVAFGSDVTMGLASGMTIKFFPLFFKNDCHMSPSAVCGIYILVPIVMAVSSSLCAALSKKVGRVQTIFLFGLTGVTLLVAMVIMYNHKINPWYIVAVYVIRTAVMNSTYPVQESILMDYVPKETRSRWKSLDSVTSFGWCGSAALGGYLSDLYGYTFSFLITAGMQLIGVLTYSSLMGIVAAEVDDEDGADGTVHADSTSCSDDDNDGSNERSMGASFAAGPV